MNGPDKFAMVKGQEALDAMSELRSALRNQTSVFGPLSDEELRTFAMCMQEIAAMATHCAYSAGVEHGDQIGRKLARKLVAMEVDELWRDGGLLKAHTPARNHTTGQT
ncbi:MAG: hypothetical protein NTW87_11935 [Planctomycetota bacterium]|nr:hypothetical protein [Planctomycetota bacterium]